MGRILPGIPDADRITEPQTRKHLVLYKVWEHHPELSITPREEHAAIDGQMVREDEYFLVGGEELMYPRDPRGSPENTYNCHCTVRHVWQEETVTEPEIDIERIVSILERVVFPNP